MLAVEHPQPRVCMRLHNLALSVQPRGTCSRPVAPARQCLQPYMARRGLSTRPRPPVRYSNPVGGRTYTSSSNTHSGMLSDVKLPLPQHVPRYYRSNHATRRPRPAHSTTLSLQMQVLVPSRQKGICKGMSTWRSHWGCRRLLHHACSVRCCTLCSTTPAACLQPSLAV